MQQFQSIADLRHWSASVRQSTDKPLAIVPTMGALHDGHLSLVQAALDDGCTVLVSIFVNPTQFAAHEDLDSYPSTLEQDLSQLRAIGAHAAWTPATTDMYPGGDHMRVRMNGPLTQAWEGEFRPHFFEGVATVVAKLFIASRTDRAYFGQKDFQQLAVVRAMARDLLLPIDVIGCATVREDTGLAMSSRNAYLTETQRENQAPVLHQALQQLANDLRDGQDIQTAENTARQGVIDAGFASIDYLSAVDAETLAPLSVFDPNRKTQILAAAYLGTTRLIDNIAV